MTGLGPRVLIVAFDGWNDAGEAASSALAHLRSTQDYTAVFTVDPELYFDYQYTRPQLQADETGTPVLVWPEATIWRPEPAADGLWLLGGVEPARAWKAFVAEIVDAALREDVTGMVLLGSMMSDVPHTRPITVFRSSDNAPLRRALELERPSYEGPVGILTVLAEAAEAAGIPTLSLWASVPHYIAGHSPSPKATLALLDVVEELTGIPLVRGELAAASLAWEASVDAAASEDEEMTDYIHQLERTRDAWDSPEASGDAIAQEFERYLRRRDDGPSKPGRDEPWSPRG